MKLKQWGRTALLVGVSAVLGLGTLSCTDYNLGYLFVTSGRYNQIYAYIIDANTGGFRLLNTQPNNYGGQGNPGSSGGANPTKLVVANGGSYLYVLNQGTSTVQLFTVGGDGVLFPVNGVTVSPTISGQDPIDMKLSADGNYLYVLNQYGPTSYVVPGTSDTPCVAVPSTNCPGTIAIYSIGPKGILSPVPNTLDTTGPTIYYWNVGFLPLQMYAGGGSVFTVDTASSGSYTQGSSDIYIWNVAPSGGGFTQPSVASVACPGCDLVALTGNGSYLYAVDFNSGDVYGYQIGSSGLTSLVGSPFYVCHGTTTTTPCTNIGPNYLSIDPSGKYLYITTTKVNPPSSTNPNPSSTVYAFFFPSTGTNAGVITFIDGFGVGPNPQCISISTGTEYLYTANYNDGTVTGYQIATINGTLRTILGGPATQTTAGQANCLAFSSRI